MEALLAKVLEAVGKTPEQFEQEVSEMKDQTEAAKTLESIKQQQAEMSAMLLDFMEFMTNGGSV